jgi:ABC-type multidrug transport system fused ATPase/permease subunit
MLPLWDKGLLVVLISIASATVSVIPPWILKFFVDVAIPQNNWSIFLAVFLSYIALDLVNRLIWTTGGIINRYIDLRVNLALKKQFFEHLQRLSMTFLQNRPVGEHMYRSSADIDAVMRMVTDILPDAVKAVYEFALILLLTSFLSPQITFVILLYSIPYTMLAHWFATRVRVLDRVTRERWQRRDAGLQEGIAGIATVKAYGRRRHEVRHQNHLTVRGFRANAALFWLRNVAQRRLVGDLLPWLKTQMLRIYFFRQVILGEMSYGSVFPVIDYTNRLTNPIQRIVDYFQQVRVAMIPAERILETLDIPPRVVERKGARRMPAIRGEVRFENVSFQYEDGRGVLEDLSFTITPGRKIAIVGHSGAGKSTIASLLLRLYDPSAGRVLVDGVDLRDVRLRAYQEQIGLVLQDTYLFQGTIRENLLFSKPRASDEELERAAKLADIHDYIAALPNGYDQDMGEGTKLSVGQRQRIGIARALLRDPRILLLDEPTSSLDSRTEMRVQETLRRASAGRTTILITHRLSTVRDADEIWVMDAGRIVERGTHQELLARRGHYYGMYALYFGLKDGPEAARPGYPLAGAASPAA